MSCDIKIFNEVYEKIIKGSELWRMSNYVGRDTGEFSKDKLSGTQRLVKAIHEAIGKTRADKQGSGTGATASPTEE